MSLHSDETLWSHYELMDQIGQGGCSRVRMARHRLTGVFVAIKILNKLDEKFIYVQSEVDILKMLHHPNIVTLFEIIETEQNIYLVQELCQDTLSKHITKGGMEEEKVRTIFRQVVEAVRYCHDRGIAHRDIKPNNIMMDAAGKVTLIDFGMATTFRAGEKFTTYCGGFSYIPPEVFMHQPYDASKKDMWTLGVLLYHMITGTRPFEWTTTRKEQRRKIIRGKYEVPSHVSEEVRDLISHLLKVRPDQRSAANEVIKHPWLQRGQESPSKIGKTFHKRLDPAILVAMKSIGLNTRETCISIMEGQFNSLMAVYLFLEHQACRKHEDKAQDTTSPGKTQFPTHIHPSHFSLALKRTKSQLSLKEQKQPKEGEQAPLNIRRTSSAPIIQNMATLTQGSISPWPFTAQGTAIPVASPCYTIGQWSSLEFPEKIEKHIASAQGSQGQASHPEPCKASAASTCAPKGPDQPAAPTQGPRRRWRLWQRIQHCFRQLCSCVRPHQGSSDRNRVFPGSQHTDFPASEQVCTPPAASEDSPFPGVEAPRSQKSGEQHLAMVPTAKGPD